MVALGLAASADAGDFSLDFVAAQDSTYHKNGPDEGDEIGPAEGQNLAFDDRTINTDVVEQLEAEDFACNDRIIFFTQIVVDDAPAERTTRTSFSGVRLRCREQRSTRGRLLGHHCCRYQWR